MAGVFVFSEDLALARQLLTPALELKASLGEPLVALTTSEAGAKELAALGADRAIWLKTEAAPEQLALALADLLGKEQASVVLVGGTLRGKHVASQVAARLDAAMATDAKTLKIADGKLEITRVLYAGLAVAEEVLVLPAVATVPARTFLPPSAVAQAGAVETVELAGDARVTITAVTATGNEGVDISAASMLVSIGRGFRKQDDVKLAADLAGAIKAELACTRGIAEDEHWLPIERYIGISGQTVKPELYLAVGLSGQVQHMVGCRESKLIVAVNNDERAPIFEAADYGIVGDLYQVLPLLTAALKN
ncbi:MAG: electron transfer flavoprotein subunit alpha/FixB family protein [Acidobacteriota bacterium]|nr:electron transfer flavoprotein subunit alpha/FixB family protein [Acidobacteriota bacterium]